MCIKRSGCCWVLLVSMAVLLGPAVQARGLGEGVSFARGADGRGYVVRVRTTERVSAYSAPRFVAGQLEWTIFNAALARSYHRAPAQGPVKAYTVEGHGGHVVLRFTLHPAVEVEAAAYRDRASTDLLLGLTYRTRRPVAAASQDPPVRTAAMSSEGTLAEGEYTSSAARWELDTIVIDAGHGGKDPGAQAYGIDEKDVVLDIALKLGHYIETKMPGVDVVYTRKDDRFITLRNRGHIANQAGGKLFISIHANAARNRSARGTETYFLGMHKTEAARQVMERENSVIRLENNPEQYKDLSEGVMQTLAYSAYMRQSEHLAELVQQQFEERVHRVNRGVKQAGFLVLWAASMPAILVETGFLTNRAEARFLTSEQGQTYIASAIFRAVRVFKQDYAKGLHLD